MIWTDVFQAVIMLIGFLVITIKGSIELGGFGEAWRICEENGRIDFVQLGLLFFPTKSRQKAVKSFFSLNSLAPNEDFT